LIILAGFLLYNLAKAFIINAKATNEKYTQKTKTENYSTRLGNAVGYGINIVLTIFGVSTKKRRVLRRFIKK